jgi:hypothetical protein
VFTRTRGRLGTVLAALGLVVGAAAAMATPASADAPNPIVSQGSGSSCTMISPNWGGTFWCGSEDFNNFPNHTFQVFVVAVTKDAQGHTFNAVWTRWNNTDGSVSAWTNMGGKVDPESPFVVVGSNTFGTFSPTIAVFGLDHNPWCNTRLTSPQVHWSGWQPC